jgi:hypothetical protein
VSSCLLIKTKTLFSDGINFLESWFQFFRATKILAEGGVVCSHVKSFHCLMSRDSAVDSLRWLNTDRITTNVFPFYWCFVILAVMTLGSCLFPQLSLPLDVLCYSETSVKFYKDIWHHIPVENRPTFVFCYHTHLETSTQSVLQTANIFRDSMFRDKVAGT